MSKKDLYKILVLLSIAFVTGLVFGIKIKRKYIKIMNYQTKKTITMPLPVVSPEITITIDGSKYDVAIKKG